MRRRYRAIELIAAINVTLGGLIIIAAMLAGLVVLFGVTDVPLVVPLYVFLLGVGVVATGELMGLAIDVAESNRQIAADLRRLLTDRVAPASGQYEASGMVRSTPETDGNVGDAVRLAEQQLGVSRTPARSEGDPEVPDDRAPRQSIWAALTKELKVGVILVAVVLFIAIFLALLNAVSPP